MNAAPGALDTAELALRIAERPDGAEWLVLQVPAGLEQETAEELASAIDDIAALEAEVVQVHDARELLARVATGASPATPPGTSVESPGIRIVWGLSDLPESDWKWLDLARSRLAHAGRVVLVMAAQSGSRLFRCAPNLASWIGAAVWTLDRAVPVLSVVEREQRLQALRTQLDLSDDEVIARAERGELPDDPEYAEWLVLLDRGDLVAPEGSR